MRRGTPRRNSRPPQDDACLIAGPQTLIATQPPLGPRKGHRVTLRRYTAIPSHGIFRLIRFNSPRKTRPGPTS